jgi:hypothetical protein
MACISVVYIKVADPDSEQDQKSITNKIWAQSERDQYLKNLEPAKNIEFFEFYIRLP